MPRKYKYSHEDVLRWMRLGAAKTKPGKGWFIEFNGQRTPMTCALGAAGVGFFLEQGLPLKEAAARVLEDAPGTDIGLPRAADGAVTRLNEVVRDYEGGGIPYFNDEHSRSRAMRIAARVVKKLGGQ